MMRLTERLIQTAITAISMNNSPLIRKQILPYSNFIIVYIRKEGKGQNFRIGLILPQKSRML